MTDTFEMAASVPASRYVLSPRPSADPAYQYEIYEPRISEMTPFSHASLWPTGPSSTGMPAVVETPRGVSLNYESMERGRPYPVEVGGYWIIAVLHHGASQATLYRVPDND